MLVDAVLLHDELDLLQARAALLHEHVDLLVVAESAWTFTGRPKPRHLSERLADGAAPPHLGPDRVRVVEYRLPPGEPTTWQVEKHARTALAEALREIAPDAVALFCDVDEIPSDEQAARARSVTAAHAVPMRTSYRRANWMLESANIWRTPKVSPVADLPDDIDELRWARGQEIPDLAGEAGLHASYLGFTAADLARKYASFSHTELDTPEASSARLLDVADRYAVDHLGRPRQEGRGLLTVLPPARWGQVQQDLHALHPEWFDVERPGSWLRRNLEATVIDGIVGEEHLPWQHLLGRGPAMVADAAGRDALRRTLGRLRRDGPRAAARSYARHRGALR